MTTGVVFYQADSADGLENLIADFLKGNEVKIINVSLSTCYDQENKYVVYVAAVAYSYDD